MLLQISTLLILMTRKTSFLSPMQILLLTWPRARRRIGPMNELDDFLCEMQVEELEPFLTEEDTNTLNNNE